jgi:hypothetical protein
VEDGRLSQPYVLREGSIRSQPYAPQGGSIRSQPYAPQEGSIRSQPYAPQEGSIRSQPYAPQEVRIEITSDGKVRICYGPDGGGSGDGGSGGSIGGGGGSGKSGQRQRLPNGWIRDILGTTIKSFAEADTAQDEIGIELANDAKAPLAGLPFYARFATGIAIALVEEGEQTVRVAAVAGRGSGTDLIGEIEQVLGVKTVSSGGMHAEEYLWNTYGDRIKVIGVSDAAGPCYTSGDNCATLLRSKNFYNVYWDSQRR